MPLIRRGFKASVKPVLLINISFALLISTAINVTEPNWDFTLRDAIFLTVLNIGALIMSTLMGMVLVGLVLAIWKSRLPNALGISLSCIIGAMPLIATNYILWTLFFIPSFRDYETFIGQFLPLYIIPDIANILVLLYVGQKINNFQKSKESSFVKVI